MLPARPDGVHSAGCVRLPFVIVSDQPSIKIDGLVFDRASYDAEGDVLYLARGHGAAASDAALTPEGHGNRSDNDGQVIGVTIINARFILDRDGRITITVPHTSTIDQHNLAAVLA